MSWLRMKLARGPLLSQWTHTQWLNGIISAVEQAGLRLLACEEKARRPDIISSPPLPLGYTSRCEYIDVIIGGEISCLEIDRLIAAQLPDGCRLLWIGRLRPWSPHLRASVAGFWYTAQGCFDPARASLFMNANTWPLAQQRKKGARSIDLRRAVPHLDVRPSEVRMYIEAFPEGMPKPAEVLASVFGTVPEDPGALIERASIQFHVTAPSRRLQMEFL